MTKEIYDDSYIETKDNIATIGFNNDPESLKAVNNIIFMEFSIKPGDKLNKGDKMLSVEAMKGTFELHSRLSGEVAEINREIEEDPDLLKEKPSEWLIRIKIPNKN